MINYYGIVLDENGNVPEPEAEFFLTVTSQGIVLADNIRLFRDVTSQIQFACPFGSEVSLTINGTPHVWTAPTSGERHQAIPLTQAFAHSLIRARVPEPVVVEPRNSAEEPATLTDGTIWFYSNPAQGVEI